MATLAQLRTRVDTFLADRWPTIIARQQNFFANRGKYWQGLRTHTIVPAHTNASDGDSIADKLNANPSDQFDNWLAVFPEWDGLSIPAALQCDVYDGPAGKGYVVTILTRYNGTLYARAQNVGPETHRQYDWTVVNEGGPI